MKEIENLKYISEKSEYVFVNYDKIYSFLNQFNDFNYNYWLSDTKIFKSEKEKIIFSFLCESINFCFWENTNWKIEYKEKFYQGSEALFYSLLKAIDNGILCIDIDKLLGINQNEFNSIFCSNGDMPSLMSERYSIFCNTMDIIKSKGNIFFEQLFSIETADELIKYITSNFKHFDDTSIYKGRIIHFNKRAILLVNDLYNLSSTIKKNIKNIDSLTGCADYSIPKVFVAMGIFKYDDRLLNKVISKDLIEHNSQMEIEIRGNTLYVIELMIDYLNKKGICINSVELDNIIWKMRKQIKNNIPVHRTKCIYY